MSLTLCGRCQRHIRTFEASCPFCGHALVEDPRRRAIVLALAPLALSLLVGCEDKQKKEQERLRLERELEEKKRELERLKEEERQAIKKGERTPVVYGPPPTKSGGAPPGRPREPSRCQPGDPLCPGGI